MGSLFGGGQGLTNPDTALMKSASSDEPLFIGTPSQVQQHLSQTRDQQLKGAANNPVMNPKPQAPFATVGQPTFQQAASSGAAPGGVNATSPGLNKAGKLVTLLQSGLQGALAGRAASEQATVASGGRRSGGAGMGFEAAQAYPWQKLGQQLGAQQQMAQTGVLQSEAQNVNIPGIGQIPGWLAKNLGPAYLRAQSAENVADTRVQGAKDVQGMRGDTAEDIADKKIKAAQGGIQIPVDETVANLAGMPSLAGKSVGKQDWDTINKSLTAKGYKTQDLGQEGLWLLDRGGNRLKRIGESPGVGRMQALAQSRVVAGALDPEEPGNLTYMSAGQAERTGALAPGSAPTAAAKKAATSEVPTNVGNQKVAFNTAIQHADLLRKAAKALNNGDVRLLNSLSNRAASEFGDPALTNFDAIANAYNHEVTMVVSKNHITNAEVDKGGATMPSSANYATIDRVLGSYQALMQSKMNMLQKQVNASRKGGSGQEIHYHIENGQLVKN